MKIEGTFLRSKIARRVLMFFLLSAFIPFLFLAVLYFIQTSSMLVKQGHSQLQAASAAYGTAVYERLLVADQLLSDAANIVSEGGPLATSKERLGWTFSGLSIVMLPDTMIPVFGEAFDVQPLSGAALAHLRRGKTLLTSGEVKGRGRRILLLRALNPLAAEPRLLAAEVDAGYLWGDSEVFPYMTTFCVLNESNAVLACQAPFQSKAIETLIRQSSGSTKGWFNWQEGDEKFLTDYQEVFLEPKFFAARWIVAAAQPEAAALEHMATFNRIFWGTVVISVLVVTLLSLTLIRRTLVPLERLIEGTRRLGRSDFSTAVEVLGRDEFGELAGSFNLMAVRLGRQFDTLTALSTIDRAILSELDMDRIVDEVLRRLKESFKADCVSISVVDHDLPGKLRTCVLLGDGIQLPVERHTLAADAREALVAHPQGLWMSAQAGRLMMPAWFEGLSAQHYFTLPIIWKDRIVGAIRLGFEVPTALGQEDIAHIRDYADRVAVALSTVAREDQLYQQVRTDPLTGLPNRFLFMERLEQEIAQAYRDDRTLALLFIDLDRFKGINDSLGHAAGDELLRQAAARLRQCVREGDTVARLGGDEFTIIVSSIDSSSAVATVARHAIDALSKPFVIDQVESVVSASIGITMYPSDGNSAEDLMRNADTAMYRAKDGGRGMYVFFEEEMNAEAVRRSTVERELRHAIAEQQFVLHYQPQVDPHTGRVRGVEALVRWNHPVLGLIGPNQFIPIAEETGLITEIGHIVLVEACAQFHAWRERDVDLDYVAVNVSSRQFRQPDFVETIQATLKQTGMPAQCLELEITESVLLDGADSVVGMLSQFKGLGIQVSIDDFGTGYSSMSYLERLPFDTLKIDISFVRKIRDDGTGGTIAATIATMAHGMGKKVVAEGVETQAQLDFLSKLGGDLLVQGFFYSRPLPAQDVVAFVSRQQLAQTLAVAQL